MIVRTGGYDFNCFSYKIDEMPLATDSADECGRKVLSMASWAADHSNYDMVVAFGGDEGGQGGYNDTTAAGAVAAFMLVRGQHWLFSIGQSRSCNPRHYPVQGRCHSDGCGLPCNSSNNQLDPASAQLLVTDFGKPLGLAHAVPGKPHVFARTYERATVTLNCSDYSATFAAETQPVKSDD